MNLHGIVSGAIGSINPFIPAVIKQSTGYTVTPAGRQEPSYAESIEVSIQRQELTQKDLTHLKNVPIQGVYAAAYLNGNYYGIVRDEGRGVIARMQAEYVEQTGINSLKIKHNNVLGYFIETTATHADKMLSEPLNQTFKHRQTTANQVRFTTVPLSEMETRILNAGGRALEIEKRLYDRLKETILESAPLIGGTARALSVRTDLPFVDHFLDLTQIHPLMWSQSIILMLRVEG